MYHAKRKYTKTSVHLAYTATLFRKGGLPRNVPFHFGSRDSGWLQVGRPRDMSSSPGRGKIVVQTASGAHPASYATATGEGGLGVKLITHLQQVQRSRIVDLYLQFPHTSSLRGA
jgi:hypothetical protein